VTGVASSCSLVREQAGSGRRRSPAITLPRRAAEALRALGSRAQLRSFPAGCGGSGGRYGYGPRPGHMRGAVACSERRFLPDLAGRAEAANFFMLVP